MKDEEAEKLVTELWRGVGFMRMLQIIAKVIQADTDKIPKEFRFRQEIEMKNGLCNELKETAAWMEE